MHGDGTSRRSCRVDNAVAPELALDLAEARYADGTTRPSVRLLAYATAWCSAPPCSAATPTCRHRPERPAHGLWVVPAARRRGTAAPSSRPSAGGPAARADELEGLSSDADPAGQAFLERRGFAERDRSRYVALDVGTPARAAGSAART